MDTASILALAVFVAAAVAAAASGAIFKPGEWYESLRHPSWRPPNWIFPVVWTPLYATIAAAGFLVWQETGWIGGALPLGVYAVQLVLNFAWSAVFFGLRRPDWALVEVAFLWLSIVATIAVFLPVSALAGWILVPYLVWVTFASYLNWTLMRLNPDAHRLTPARG